MSPTENWGRSEIRGNAIKDLAALNKVVGDPGSGKTSLAVLLQLQLLEDWQAGEAVPVLFSLVSWDPHMQPRVQDCLANQLMAVLDGLDEIPPGRRGEVIERLNASLYPDTGLIMTSCTAEYTEAATPNRHGATLQALLPATSKQP